MKLTCEHPGCTGVVDARNLCNNHYQQARQRGDFLKEWVPCAVTGCVNAGTLTGKLCPMHHARMKRRGDTGPAHRLTRKAGEGTFTKSGYRVLHRPEHPNAFPSNGNVLEHVLVMSELLGRPLLPGENVHHKNGVRDDNRPENLELWSTSQPSGQRIEDKVDWAVEFLRTYAPGKLHPELYDAFRSYR